MSKLFGIPLDSLAAGLAVILFVAVGAVAALALRHRVFLRLGLRNIPRRPGRSALIVIGLMLGTTIVAAALTTGDTMAHTIRTTAVATLGATDETIAPRGAVDDIPGELGAATGTGWIDESVVAEVESVAFRSTHDGESVRIVVEGTRAGRRAYH